MSTITVLPDATATPRRFRASLGLREGTGATVGEAVDALGADVGGVPALIVVQPMVPDPLFTAAQQQRLGDLMTRWRNARDAGIAFPAEEQQELDALVAAELRAAGERAAAWARQLSP